MKIFTFIAALGSCILLTTVLSAQTSLSVENEQVSMSKGKHNAYILTIPQADYESSLKNWKKEIRQNTKSKVEESDHEVFIAGTQIDLIHTAPINEKREWHFHWHIELMPKLTNIAGFEWGSGFYINPTPPEEAAEFLRELTLDDKVASR